MKKTNILVGVLFFILSFSAWAGLASTCVSFTNGGGDLIECRLDLDAIDSKVAEQLNDATKLHYYLMKRSASYRSAYKNLVISGERPSQALYVGANGEVEYAEIVYNDSLSENGNGSTGGWIGKPSDVVVAGQNGNGSTGGWIGKSGNDVVTAGENGNGSTGGWIGKPRNVVLAGENGNGSTGGWIGKSGNDVVTAGENGNGSTGGWIGKSGNDVVTAGENGNGSTGGWIGKISSDVLTAGENGNGSTGGWIGKPSNIVLAGENGNGSTGGWIGEEKILIGEELFNLQPYSIPLVGI